MPISPGRPFQESSFMHYQKMSAAEPRPGDNPAFLEALDKLVSAGADPRRPVGNDHQIKVTPSLSFYPGTGVVFRDGDRAPLPIRGVKALIEHLRAEGNLTALATG